MTKAAKQRRARERKGFELVGEFEEELITIADKALGEHQDRTQSP
jgi:hypothetical protein